MSSSTKSKILACVSRKAKSLGCGSSSKDESEADKIIDSEEYRETHDFVQFLEEIEEGYNIDREETDRLRERSAHALAKLRKQEDNEVAINTYMQRNIYSLFDSILDQLAG